METQKPDDNDKLAEIYDMYEGLREDLMRETWIAANAASERLPEQEDGSGELAVEGLVIAVAQETDEEEIPVRQGESE